MTVEEIEKLALEEHDLQEKIPQAKKENKIKKRKYKLQAMKATLKLLPVFLPIPITGIIFEKVFDESPLKVKPEKISAKITEEYSKDGTKTIEKVYSKSNPNSQLSYYTSWKPEKDNIYSRKVYTYELSLTKENKDVIEYIISNEELLPIKDIEKQFKENGIEPNKKERKEYTSEPSKKQEGYIEATIVTSEKFDKIEIPGSMSMHILYQILILMLSLASEVIMLQVDEETKEKKILTYMAKQQEKLVNKPKLENIKELNKRLQEIKALLNNPDLLLYDTDKILELPQQQQILEQPEPQKVLKKEPERMQQQGQ